MTCLRVWKKYSLVDIVVIIARSLEEWHQKDTYSLHGCMYKLQWTIASPYTHCELSLKYFFCLIHEVTLLVKYKYIISITYLCESQIWSIHFIWTVKEQCICMLLCFHFFKINNTFPHYFLNADIVYYCQNNGWSIHEHCYMWNNVRVRGRQLYFKRVHSNKKF